MVNTIGIVDVAFFAATTEGAPADCNDHCYPPFDQFGRERRQAIILTVCPPIFDCDVRALNIAVLFETLMYGGHILHVRRSRRRAKKPDRRQRWLSSCRKRPGRRATEKHDEVAPLHANSLNDQTVVAV
jgi:hypothetical protein